MTAWLLYISLAWAQSIGGGPTGGAPAADYDTPEVDATQTAAMARDALLEKVHDGDIQLKGRLKVDDPATFEIPPVMMPIDGEPPPKGNPQFELFRNLHYLAEGQDPPEMRKPEKLSELEGIFQAFMQPTTLSAATTELEGYSGRDELHAALLVRAWSSVPEEDREAWEGRYYDEMTGNYADWGAMKALEPVDRMRTRGLLVKTTKEVLFEAEGRKAFKSEDLGLILDRAGELRRKDYATERIVDLVVDYVGPGISPWELDTIASHPMVEGTPTGVQMKRTIELVNGEKVEGEPASRSCAVCAGSGAAPRTRGAASIPQDMSGGAFTRAMPDTVVTSSYLGPYGRNADTYIVFAASTREGTDLKYIESARMRVEADGSAVDVTLYNRWASWVRTVTHLVVQGYLTVPHRLEGDTASRVAAQLSDPPPP